MTRSTIRGAMVAGALLVGVLVRATPARADGFEDPPISYSQSQPDNPIERLETRLASGELKLEREPHFGYLRGVLSALGIDTSSQVMVFSKTSLQRHRIAPSTPRALYFNDEVYIGFCQGGDVLEVSAADPALGTVFYSVDQHDKARAHFTRQTDNCLICHGSSQTRDVPGHVVRSLFVRRDGQPILSERTYRIDHTSPIAERWGGWYVTGTHGRQTHLGNQVIDTPDVPSEPDPAAQNVTSLVERIDIDNYLSPHSDLVALMVLEHQADAHNRLTQANFATRQALYFQDTLNRELKEPEDHEWASTHTRITSACEPLVEYLFFSGEAKLEEPISGTSSFAATFANPGPRDRRGRSLRELDLKTRMFKYPLSYLVYSPSFASLPPRAKTYVFRRMREILSGDDHSPKFAHLTADDRSAIREILEETLPEYASFRVASR